MSYQFQGQYAWRQTPVWRSEGRYMVYKKEYQYGWGVDQVWKPSDSKPLTYEQAVIIVNGLKFLYDKLSSYYKYIKNSYYYKYIKNNYFK